MSATPPEVLLKGPALEVIEFNFGGMTSEATRRGFAHLWEFQRRAQIMVPGCWLRIIQPAFNRGVKASAGTHDKADVWDYEIVGWDNWFAESQLARRLGFTDWVRHPGQGFSWHHHAISRGLPDHMYGDLVPAQIADYRNHALGLKDLHTPGNDPQCTMSHKIEPLFNYEAWKKRYTMLDPSDKLWLQKTIAAETEDAVAAALKDAKNLQLITNGVMAENVFTKANGDKVNMRTAMRELYGDAIDPTPQQ